MAYGFAITEVFHWTVQLHVLGSSIKHQNKILLSDTTYRKYMAL